MSVRTIKRYEDLTFTDDFMFCKVLQSNPELCKEVTELILGKKIGGIAPGQAVTTPAFRLPAKYIIHTVCLEWIDGKHGERDAVRSCYEKSLLLAKELKCESVAFPLIATGVYGFPKEEVLQIAVSVFGEFLVDTEMEIILVVFDETSFELSGKIFSGVDAYIDENYVSEKINDEYSLDSVYHDRIQTGKKREKRGFFEKAAARMAVPMPTASAEKEGRSLADIMKNISETWQESLFRLIDEKGYTDTEVYKRANVDRKLFSKIRSNSAYQPKKITAVAFALALKLNLDETKDLLGRAGYALSPSSRFDLIIKYFIEREVYDIYTINLALFEHDQPLLGA